MAWHVVRQLIICNIHYVNVSYGLEELFVNLINYFVKLSVFYFELEITIAILYRTFQFIINHKINLYLSISTVRHDIYNHYMRKKVKTKVKRCIQRQSLVLTVSLFSIANNYLLWFVQFTFLHLVAVYFSSSFVRVKHSHTLIQQTQIKPWSTLKYLNNLSRNVLWTPL